MNIKNLVFVLKEIVLESKRYINRHLQIGDFFLIAATLDKKGRILAIGENSVKTHPMMKKYGERTNRPHKICLHAEISALVRTAQPSHSIMVLRVNRNGDLAMAKPCPLCRMAIADANIQRIYYSDMDGDIVCLNPKEEL